MKQRLILTDHGVIEITTITADKDCDKPRNRNTELCVDVKTFLKTDRRPVINKVYTGTLVRDGEDHFQFVEADRVSLKPTRHPHGYKGELITATVQSNGNIRLNFRQKRNTESMTIEAYALSVANEIVKALANLVVK